MIHQTIFNRLRRIEGQIRGIEDMVVAEKPEQEILIQLEAARSSLSSTIGTLIGSLLKKNEDGTVVLEESQIRALLRFVKRN